MKGLRRKILDMKLSRASKRWLDNGDDPLVVRLIIEECVNVSIHFDKRVTCLLTFIWNDSTKIYGAWYYLGRHEK